MTLGDYKGRKVTKLDFWKKSWFGDIPEKVSKLAQNQTLRYFLKNGSNDLVGFWLGVNTKFDLLIE